MGDRIKDFLMSVLGLLILASFFIGLGILASYGDGESFSDSPDDSDYYQTLYK